ncbi:FIST signal transduction protein [Umezakia ovalisporum]|jgi:small ligand-binding sensory domain FIST|uniref:FIST C-terminal domain-containing protein n=1 Tax=Umezakia ovalisporum FSS-62 TaxID=2971776 RepID=A0AA43H0P7_9CYAN|nr:FIST N-terminal domain-containing protein [Umezakia ovalisporum]MDH6065050.1 FIST C-terminal domain-containing protein [Umezakia ovalisporum FSS-62]MDH6067167.1 FIST C-terminal domain-containing protein [Umezakia ovalisporum APH033B]MDH6077091.1 FIST C-terminal domain-containing protein [Umezakia ovalisporum FSS-45]MDH6102323.1 FIST C-terminal domain-containing protein [Umezakia ovalisporum ANA283AFssAo]
MADQMQWANALSTRPSLEAAVTDVVEQAVSSLTAPADLGLVFISSAFASEYSRLLPLLAEKLSIPVMIGCSGLGVIGTKATGEPQELETVPAISLTLGHLPGVNVQAFHVTAEQLPDLDSSPDAWINVIGVQPSPAPQFILLSSGFSPRINDLLQGLDFAYPGSVIIGGQASSGGLSREISLFCHDAANGLDQQLYREGTLGLALSGNIVLQTIVAQGCRPIGLPMQVTKAERNIILELDETAPLVVLRDMIASLSEQERILAQHSLFVGIVMDQFKSSVQQGDFLIRSILGVDPSVGAIAIGDVVRPGQRLQFQLRDAKASAEDLELLLKQYQNQDYLQPAAAALMFSCVGRGQSLYGQSNFDSQLFRRYIQDIPIGGFFCNGEIGPVGGNTFVHGYTSVFAVVHPISGEA